MGAVPEFHDTRSPIPVIETDRLRLRGHRLADFEACAAMWADPLVTRFIGGKPSSPQQSWARLLGYIGHWSVLHFGYWAIEEKATDSYIGEIGFADFKRDIVPAMKEVPELGFALSPVAHGKGFATEAGRAVVVWGDDNLSAARTVCMIDPENVGSLGVVAKCGYELYERGTFGGKATLFLARNATPKIADSAADLVTSSHVTDVASGYDVGAH